MSSSNNGRSKRNPPGKDPASSAGRAEPRLEPEDLPRPLPDLRRGDSALRESEERVHSLFEQSPMGYQSLDAEGRFLDVNPAWLEMLGYAREDVIGKWFGDFLVPESVDAFRERFPRFKAAGNVHTEFQMLHRDGRRRTIVFDGRIERHPDGSFRQTHCILSDATERQQAEAQRKAAAAHETAILATVPDIIMEVDNRQVYTWANPAGREFFGADVVGRKATDFFEGEQDTLAAVQPLFAGSEKVIYLESWQRRKDGAKRLLAWWCHTLKDEQGRVIGALSTARDVTEQKRAEQAAEQAARDWQTTFDASNDAIWLLDGDHRVLRSNRTAEKIFGRPRADFLGQPCWEFAHGLAAPHPDCPFVRARRSGRRETMELRQGERWLEVNVDPIFDAAGRHAGAVHVVSDVTERKQSEEKLRQSEEKQRRLFETMSEGVFYQRADGTPTDVNPAALRMFGLSREEFLNRTSLHSEWDVIREDGTPLPGPEHPSMQALRTGQPVRDLVVGIRNPKTQAYTWVSVSGLPEFRDGEATPWQVVVTLHDLTARKQTELALRERDELLSTFMRHSPIYTFIKEVSPTESRVLMASENYREMIGIPGSQMAGKTMTDLFPADFAAKITADDWNVVSGKKVLKQEEELQGRFYTTIKFPIALGEKNLLAGYTIDVTERKQTEETLRASEERFRAIFDRSTVGKSLTAPDGKLLRVNAAFARMLGLSIEELQQANFAEITHPDDLAGSREVIRCLLANEREACRIEKRYRHKNGHFVWCDMSTTLLRDGQGRPLYFITSIQDITERKRAEEELKRRESLLQKIFDLLPIGLWFADKDGQLIRGNPAGVKIWGAEPRVAPADYGVFKARRLPSGEEIAPADWALARTIREGATIQNELLEIDAFDGVTRTILNTTAPVLDEQGAIQGAIIVNLDVTDLKQVEQALLASESKLRSILDNVGIGVALIGPNMDVLELNRQMRTWFPNAEPGRRPICYRTFNQPPREAICDYCPTAKTLQDGQVHEAQTQTPAPTGHRSYRIVSSPLFDSNGRVTAAIELVEDVTEKSALEIQLRQAQKMESVGRLAGGVAHDFNNMLGVILGHAEMALELARRDAPLVNNLMEIRKAAERSADLTRQLLAFARKQTVAPKVVDLNHAIDGMLNMLRRLIGENVRLDWRPAPTLWPVWIDPSQVDQIVANLCVNARDAIAGVGTVTLETAVVSVDDAACAVRPGFVPGDFVRLLVRDTGCGMDAETLSHVFEPFFTTKGLGEGTGLGLATVYGAVKQNNGFVFASSEPGRGTAFEIYLPRHAAKTELAPRASGAAPAPRGHETILLVEDEPAILDITAQMLEQQGYTVLTAATPGAAIRLARDHSGGIDLLLTDIVMPEMNGRDLARRLLSLYPNLKRLFMSGYTASVIAHQGVLDAGVHFIQKPFTLHILAEKIRAALDSRLVP